MTDESFITELAGIEKNSRAKLDDGSIGFLARPRGAGVLQDAEWERSKGFRREALDFLAPSNEPESKSKGSGSVLSMDADPRNADWFRIVRANRLAGCRLPTRAAL
jgi:hypothetical protein